MEGEEHQIWGPRADDFTVGALKPEDPREEGGGLLWCERALTVYYFIHHDNEPADWEIIRAWCDDLTPAQVKVAVELALIAGLP